MTPPSLSPTPSARRWPRVVLAVLLVVAALAALDALWIEPRLLLVRDRVELDLVPGSESTPEDEPYRIVHLADLHMETATGLYDRLLERIAAEEPDLVLVSGDLVADAGSKAALERHARAAADWVRRLRRVAPVLAVQGHSEYLGEVVAELAAGGVEWLSNEGRRIGPGGEVLLVGLNQQVGYEAGAEPPRVFTVETVDGRPAVVARPDRRANRYLSYDPLPPGAPLETTSGALSWSGYDAAVSVRLDGAEGGAGLAVHARNALGEDRSIRLARALAGDAFALTFNGTAPASGEGAAVRLDTGVVPEPGRWYRVRMRTEVAPEGMTVRGKVWPEGEQEPAGWQAWADDRSPSRVDAGTVALWTWGEGSVAYRDLRVVEPGPEAEDGRVLLERPLAELDGFRQGTRASRMELALARSGARSPAGGDGRGNGGGADRPLIVLTHSPDPVVEAARRGARLVLAGHTHGGQVRVPFYGAPLTRSAIGRRYDRGLFEWEGGTLLYVNSGVGTAFLPIRFWNPPLYAVIDL